MHRHYGIGELLSLVSCRISAKQSRSYLTCVSVVYINGRIWSNIKGVETRERIYRISI